MWQRSDVWCTNYLHPNGWKRPRSQTGQKDAILQALDPEAGRYVGVQGYAGTGKTFMLKSLARYATQQGYEIQGYAPSHAAVKSLTGALGEAKTVSSLLTADQGLRAPPQQHKDHPRH